MRYVHIQMGNWTYDQMKENTFSGRTIWHESFEENTYIPITDRITKQACIIRSGDKYGLYLADHTSGMGGPGVWCHPCKEAFPFDEIKFCVDPFVTPAKPGLFAFRVADKWGVIEVIDCDLVVSEKYEADYLMTKGRILIKCEYANLDDIDTKLGSHHEWKDPFTQNEWA